MALNQPQLSYKSNYLFLEEEMFPRETVLQSEFESAFAPWTEEIIKAFEEASVSYEEFISINTYAQTEDLFPLQLWNFLIIGRLRKIPGLEWDKLPGNLRRFYLKIGNTKLFVKKVDENYNPRNIETAAVQKYREQVTDDLNDMDSVLFLGYQLDKTKREIIDISVVCRKGDELEWRIDVFNLFSQTYGNTPPIRPTVIPITYAAEPVEPKKLATVKVVEKEKRE